MASVHRAGVEFAGQAVAVALLRLGDANASIGKTAVESRGVSARHPGLSKRALLVTHRLVHVSLLVWAPHTTFLVQRERHFYNR
jgi:hypothetical protein